MPAVNRKLLADRISMMTATEHEEIFRVLESYDIKYTSNANGVFFNLTGVPTEAIERISGFVEFCMGNRSELDEYDKRLNECKMNNDLGGTTGSGGDGDWVVHGDGQCVGEGRFQVSATTEKKTKTKGGWDVVSTTLTISERERLRSLASAIADERDAIVKRKDATRFAAAKKRYAKRCVQEGGGCMCDELEVEKPVLV
jgi:hypothetical protein